MPDRHPRARHEPPSPVDHILAHPAETVLAGWWAMIGVILLVAQVIPGAVASPSITSLPALLAYALAGTIGLGGAAAMAGILWPGKRLTTAWAIERTGWILGAGGWTAYLTAVTTRYPESLVSISIAAAMVSVAVLRVIALYSLEHQVRHDVEAADA